jgi:hypothetical protein
LVLKAVNSLSAQQAQKMKWWPIAIAVLVPIIAFFGGTWYFLNAESSSGPSTAPATASTDISVPPEATIEDEASKVEDPKISSSSIPATSSASATVSRLTRANFDKIKKGMSEEQVRAILGSPTETTFKTDTAKDQGRMVKSLQWSQVSPSAAIEIEFIDGLAGTKTTTLPPPPPPRPKLTDNDLLAGLPLRLRQNYPLIKGGMTEDEVTDLIGPGLGTHIETGTINGNPYHIKTWSWKYYIPDQYYPYVTVIVKFTNGKVTGQNWMQVEPKKK